jgi:hypothetical protein
LIFRNSRNLTPIFILISMLQKSEIVAYHSTDFKYSFVLFL